MHSECDVRLPGTTKGPTVLILGLVRVRGLGFRAQAAL